MLPYKISDLGSTRLFIIQFQKKKFSKFSKNRTLEPCTPPKCMHIARNITQGLSKNKVRFIYTTVDPK
jgi:hypothetical protein